MTYTNKLQTNLKYLFTIIPISLLVLFVFHSLYTPKQSSTQITVEQPASINITILNDTEKNELLKSIITWDTEYSKELEDAILYNLNLIPDAILNSWLNTECSIVVCPNEKDVLRKDTISSSYPAAVNKMRTDGTTIIRSSIHILASLEHINSSLIHEIGHYVYYMHFGIENDYVMTLPYFDADNQRFCEEQKSYYYDQPKEYFAELFSHVIKNGVTDEYKDTYEIQKIIEDF